MNNLQGNAFKLLLDDMRDLSDCFPLHPAYLEQNWVVVRNYDDFVEVITKAGLPEFISFDFDLGDPAEDERTGLTCVKWLIEYCISNKFYPPEYTIHSQNPVGRDNIMNYFNQSIKYINKMKT